MTEDAKHTKKKSQFKRDNLNKFIFSFLDY